MASSSRSSVAAKSEGGEVKAKVRSRTPTVAQLTWLRRALGQPGGKLPLFDESGQRVSSSVIRACRSAGWIEPWFHNPIKPNWEVCRLTEAGWTMLAEISVVAVDFRQRHTG